MKILSFREVVLSALLLGFIALSVQQCVLTNSEKARNDELLSINHNLVYQRDRSLAYADSLTTVHANKLDSISKAIAVMSPAQRTAFNRSQLTKLGLLK